MGHHIQAIICRAPVNEEAARELDIPVFPLGDFVMLGLDVYHADHWEGKLEFERNDGWENSSMLLDDALTRHFAKRIAGAKDYALIETDYFAGMGKQTAVFYTPTEKTTCESINHALKLLGVQGKDGLDEFDTLGLSDHRNFERYFEKYLLRSTQ